MHTAQTAPNALENRPPAAVPTNNLRHWAQQQPDQLAVACGQNRLTYAQLEALANRLAHVLRSRGLVRGDHIATLMGNRPQALALVWAAYRCGLYITPLPTSLTLNELAYLVADCDARVLVVDREFAALAERLPAAQEAALQCFSLGGPIRGFAPLEPMLHAASAEPIADEAAGALMVYTSGTTGAPKGVIRPLPASAGPTPAFAADLLALFGLGGRAVRYLSTAPLYHAAPLRFALAVTAGGGCVHVMAHFDAERALDMLERHEITHSQWVPSMFQRLLALPAERRARFRAPAHRAAIHGAAPCPPAVKQAMIDWWGPIVSEYYSGSEGVGLTLIDSAQWLQHRGSVGRARKGVIHIVDEGGRELPAGETGRICFSGVAPFAYYKNPQKTLTRTLANGWQTFGDIGRVDADGYLYLSDREDDMIISGGMNIYPQEIEAAIRDVPGVHDCAVVGVDDERFGERPVAFVVADRLSSQTEPALLEAARGHCATVLGRFKQPAAFYAIDTLPRSATGKLLRRALHEQLPASARCST